ncbi:MAG: sulfatase-like hydrolase/transferase [Bryobacterales bacterium]|nr:sulfatase-like hydrolase/transferase [Bryobacterales bacterium]
MSSRRRFLASAFLSPFALPAQTRKPNIVLLVADDLGFAEIGVQGCKDIPTPNIDSIAKSGVRFSHGYVTCPVCSPTRAGLLTGRYQQRFGHEFNPGPASQASDDFGLPLNEVTLADRLKSLGYATGMVGKWHLGYRPAYLPTRRGFDEFFGFPGGAHSYLDWKDRGREGNPVMRGAIPVEETTYLTDAFAREAAAFIEKHKSRPFFLYMPFNAVHAPLEVFQKYHDRFASIADSRRRTYAGMMSAMDDAIGRILSKLREHRIEDDTLVFFVADNGGPTLQTTSSNLPLRGYKGQVYEGGIHVPFLLQWKRHLPKGVVYEKPVIAIDIHPTAVAVAGGMPGAGLDGVNLIPYLTGQNRRAPHEALFWRFGPQWAVRKGDWKLLASGQGTPELYNLGTDLAEKNDLAASLPDRVKELQAAYDDWNTKNIPAKWRTIRERGGQKKKKKRV